MTKIFFLKIYDKIKRSLKRRGTWTNQKLNAVIDVIMLAGTILLRNGSEIHRVEDTMIRIAHSQGIMDCNVLAMPAAIFSPLKIQISLA